jgi:hypothetical protein
MDDARHSYEKNKASRRWNHLLLEFPTGHELSSQVIYDDAGEDEELELEIVPFRYCHSTNTDQFNSMHYAAWNVARSDVRTRARGRLFWTT